MPPDLESSDPGDDLQFETVEPTAALSAAAVPAKACVVCRRPITSAYFAIRDKIICPACREKLGASLPGLEAGRIIQATALGIAGGLVGALIWFAIRRAAHMEIGLVAVLVGILVGKGVRKGSGNIGGRLYQVLAVLITYACIAANYMPDVLEAMSSRPSYDNVSAPERFARAFIFCLKLPFLGGTQNAIGLLIIGIALWQAWKLNIHRLFAVTGPYQLGPGGSGVII